MSKRITQGLPGTNWMVIGESAHDQQSEYASGYRDGVYATLKVAERIYLKGEVVFPLFWESFRERTADDGISLFLDFLFVEMGYDPDEYLNEDLN